VERFLWKRKLLAIKTAFTVVQLLRAGDVHSDIECLAATFDGMTNSEVIQARPSFFLPDDDNEELSAV